MSLSDDFLSMWEHIIADVHKTEVPLECIKKVVIKLHGKRQKTVNLFTLRKQGLDDLEIETVLTRTLSDLEDQVRDIEFIVDVHAVAELVQPQTDKLLSGLQ